MLELVLSNAFWTECAKFWFRTVEDVRFIVVGEGEEEASFDEDTTGLVDEVVLL